MFYQFLLDDRAALIDPGTIRDRPEVYAFFGDKKAAFDHHCLVMEAERANLVGQEDRGGQ